MKRNFKKNKGITLVALIITIVVMLILVAVSVNILIKSNLLGIAEKTTTKYKADTENEANMETIEIDGKQYNSIEEYLETTNNKDNQDKKMYTVRFCNDLRNIIAGSDCGRRWNSKVYIRKTSCRN